MIYRAGRILQGIGLVVMPAAIWIAEFQHSERGAIGIFLGSMIIFFAGFCMTRLSKS